MRTSNCCITSLDKLTDVPRHSRDPVAKECPLRKSKTSRRAHAVRCRRLNHRSLPGNAPGGACRWSSQPQPSDRGGHQLNLFSPPLSRPPLSVATRSRK